jgi:hypothetical protein
MLEKEESTFGQYVKGKRRLGFNARNSALPVKALFQSVVRF